MKKIKYLSSIVIYVFLITLFFPPPAGAETEEPAHIVVYSRNFAVVSEKITLSLESGENTVRLTGIPETLQPDSLSLEFKEPGSAVILEQKFIPPATEASMLKFNEGNVIDFEIRAPHTGERWLREGKIIRAGRDPVVEFDGRTVFGLPGKPLFDALDEENCPEPSILLRIESAVQRSENAVMSYIAGGMNWTANYNIFLYEDTPFADIRGTFLISSAAGKTFDNARVKLLAGDVSRADNARGPEVLRSMAFEDAAAPAAASRELDEYHLYSIERPLTIKDRDSIQVEFLIAGGVITGREYVFDGASREKVQTFIEFKNSDENSLGMPMPGGKIKIYRAEEDFRVFIGEDSIDHTPADEKIRLYTGTVFDLAGERKQTGHRQIASREREESYEITLRNRKKETVEINVIERPGQRDWEIREATHGYEKIDARTVQFSVSVPPGEEKKISYTVRLRW